MFRFREHHGSGVIVKTLSDMNKGEEERREAAGVLAQVLSPWIEGNSSTEDIDSSLADIVISLKGELHSVYYSQFIYLWGLCLLHCGPLLLHFCLIWSYYGP